MIDKRAPDRVVLVVANAAGQKSISLGVTVGRPGTWWVFETFGSSPPPKGSEQDIATVPATCHPLAACIREIRYVTHNGAGPHTSFNPSWSPDGQRIAFTQALFRDGKPPVGDIWTVRPCVVPHRRKQPLAHGGWPGWPPCCWQVAELGACRAAAGPVAARS